MPKRFGSLELVLRLILNSFSFRCEVRKADDHWSVVSGTGEARIFAAPLVVEFISAGEKVAVINGRQTLKFEHLRKKQDA